MAAARLSSPGLATPQARGPRLRPFLASQESLAAAILRCASAPRGASSIACGLSIAIEVAMVAGSNSQGGGATAAHGIRLTNPRRTAMICDFWSGSTTSVSSIFAARKRASGLPRPATETLQRRLAV